MRTALVSDLHLGSRREKDLLRRPEIRARLWEALEGADRLVLLGDTLELRELPQGMVLERARPFFDELAKTGIGEVVLIAGNHDHRIAEPFIEALRIANPEAALALDTTFKPNAGATGIAGGIAARLPDTRLTVAYPGFRIRDDVYATHGHYLDAHMTVPTTECISGRLAAKLVGGPPDGPRSVADYEAALAPLYAFAYAVAQGAAPAAGRVRRGDTLAADVWERASGRGGRLRTRLAGMLLRRIALPGGVAVLNRLGLGPFSAELSAGTLRRSGLSAIAEVTRSLDLDVDHLIFGHIHRPGPLPGDRIAEWRPAGSPALTNSGSWSFDEVFLGRDGAATNPYWPGSIVYVGDEGPPEIVSVLAELSFEQLSASGT